jgi:hypothetical protein
MTPLQTYVRALAGLLRHAREELTPEEFSWFVAIACDLVGDEAARLFAGELLRSARAAARPSDDQAAA